MMAATIRSGQAVAVPQTPTAASMTMTLPMASLREHSQTERTLASPILVVHQQQHAGEVGPERQEANGAHHRRFRQPHIEDAVDGGAEDPEAHERTG